MIPLLHLESRGSGTMQEIALQIARTRLVMMVLRSFVRVFYLERCLLGNYGAPGYSLQPIAYSL
jgi:hypothetical protein